MTKKRFFSQSLLIGVGLLAGSFPLIKLGVMDTLLTHPSWSEVATSNSLQASTPVSPFQKGIQQALQASRLARNAQTTQEWDQVVLQWLQAVSAMQSVPISDPKYRFAQKKVNEYLNNMTIARQRATTEQPLPFASFESEFLDEQLALYLSYLSAVGTPDVLIVGSSRAVQGIDPRHIQYGLSDQGKSAKIFNFGINGATAQVVDLLLREILTPQQLPKTIIWADGARAFNSGRPDRTYNQIVNSPGYQRLQTQEGQRKRVSEQIAGMQSFPSNLFFQRRRTSELAFGAKAFSARIPQMLESWSQPAYAFDVDLSQVDANGFLPISDRFDPRTYFQSYPLVRGRYDADYANFSLSGGQWQALERIIDYTQQQQIQLVVVNLPLTQTYLDRTRQNAENRFVKYMGQKAQQEGFGFINWGQIWLNQNGYFADPSHLNRYGAATLGRELATQASIQW